jgi:diphthine synthase
LRLPRHAGYPRWLRASRSGRFRSNLAEPRAREPDAPSPRIFTLSTGIRNLPPDMGSLCFVGLGLGPLGVTLEGLEEIRKADIVYLEYYTTPHEPTILDVLEKAAGRQLSVVDRGFVEDGGSILEEASRSRVCLVVPGDPMIATTHSDLRVRALRAGIETRVVHAASIASAAASASGLHFYKFSRATTITCETLANPEQAYRQLHRNLLEGSHTLFLLEYDTEGERGVSPSEAIEGLLRAESNFKRGVVSDDTFALVLARVGRRDQRNVAGAFSSLVRADCGDPPHSLIVPGRLHFTEVESVCSVFGVESSAVRDNSEGVRSTSQVLVPRYVEKAKRALESVRGRLPPEYSAVAENAELYMKDALDFLAKGDDELAMLSIGYAEGLLDSLGFAGVVRIEW